MAVERSREVARVIHAAKRAAGVDLEALEGAVRDAAHAGGARTLEAFLEGVGVGRRDEPVRCTCGAQMLSRGVRAKEVRTLLGPITFKRSIYVCPRCRKSRCPGDEELDVVGTSYSPGVRRLTADFGGDAPFKRVSHQLQVAAGLRISRKDCERMAEAVGEQIKTWTEQEGLNLRLAEPPAPDETPKTIDTLYIEADGTGLPMVPSELEGRKGKQADGSAKTREAKLGCVFTQSGVDDQGRPVRDPATTTFTGAIENAAAFGNRLCAEALRRGLYHARRVVFLGDGAEWVKNLALTYFGLVLFILDLYHAREHLIALCRHLFGADQKRLDLYKDRWWDYLDQGRIEEITAQAAALLPKDQREKPDARREINYLDKNKEHMRYATFRAQGLFVGSGVVEAGCKHVIGQRLKQSGMEWTVRGANAIIALRCLAQSGRFEEYWESRAA